MSFSDFFRGGRHRPHRDDNRWQDRQSRDEARNFGRFNYPPDEQSFSPRGGRQGSDFYGSQPEYRGSENDLSRRSMGYGGEYGGTRGGSSFNDRWQNSYGEASDYGREQSERSPEQWGTGEWGAQDQGRDNERWWNEMSGRPGGDMYSTRTGSFRGRGPRGYRRSDERIREDVCECLTEDDRIDATNIQVAVNECEVTLTGSVNSREEKRRAEDRIEQLSGVKDVHNSLRVVNEGGAIGSSSMTSRDEQTGTQASSQSDQIRPRH
jgi:BON domain